MHELSVTFLAFILAFACQARAELRVEANEQGWSQKGELLFWNGRPFSGEQLERWPTGAVFRDTHYRSGRMDGANLKYAPNGHLIERLNYKMGRKDGLQETWFEEGPKKAEAHFKDGVLDGKQIEWHLNGRIFREQTFQAGREVTKKVLFANGNIFSNYVKRGRRLYGQDGGALCREATEGVKQ